MENSVGMLAIVPCQPWWDHGAYISEVHCSIFALWKKNERLFFFEGVNLFGISLLFLLFHSFPPSPFLQPPKIRHKKLKAMIFMKINYYITVLVLDSLFTAQ